MGYEEDFEIDEIRYTQNTSDSETRFDRAENFSRISELQAEREKKSEILEGMVSRDFSLDPEKRFDNTKDFHYAGPGEFEEELKKREPSTTNLDARLTDGFYDPRDNQAYVREGDNTLKTGIHEKLHQKSMSELPTRLNEGVTEYLARREAGPYGDLKKIDERGREIAQAKSDYEKEVEVVHKLSALIGEKPIRAAYFNGDTATLRSAVDKELGDGAFNKLSEALEKREYEIFDKLFTKK